MNVKETTINKLKKNYELTKKIILLFNLKIKKARENNKCERTKLRN